MHQTNVLQCHPEVWCNKKMEVEQELEVAVNESRRLVDAETIMCIHSQPWRSHPRITHVMARKQVRPHLTGNANQGICSRDSSL